MTPFLSAARAKAVSQLRAKSRRKYVAGLPVDQQREVEAQAAWLIEEEMTLTRPAQGACPDAESSLAETLQHFARRRVAVRSAQRLSAIDAPLLHRGDGRQAASRRRNFLTASR